MDELRLNSEENEKEMKHVFHEAKFVVEAIMKLMPRFSIHSTCKYKTCFK